MSIIMKRPDTYVGKSVNKWSSHLWINPTPEKYWNYSQSTQIIKKF